MAFFSLVIRFPVYSSPVLLLKAGYKGLGFLVNLFFLVGIISLLPNEFSEHFFNIKEEHDTTKSQFYPCAKHNSNKYTPTGSQRLFGLLCG